MIPTTTVHGVERVEQKLVRFPQSLRAELRRSVAKLAFEVTDTAVANVSGRLLKRRTGALAGSINPRVTEDASGVTAVVSAGGVAAKYARVHEYGFEGPESVKAHMRRIKQAWGRPIEPREVRVSAHTRNVNVPEKAYLRGALRQHKADILARLGAAAERAAKATP